MKIVRLIAMVAVVGLYAACGSSGSGDDSSVAGSAGTLAVAGSGGTSAGGAGGGGAAGTATDGSGGASGTPGTAGASGGSGGGAALCGGARCPDASTCVNVGGVESCEISCSTNSECPGTVPCCEPLPNNKGFCAAATGQQCRCTTGAECSTGACAPSLDSSQNPVGPYVCVLNDNAPYHGCSKALSSCDTGFCCFTDANANEFCAAPCTGNNQCGDASCNTYSNAHTTCGGTLGCGPTP